MDRRHLRLPARRLARHDGHARRPNRPPPRALDRRGRIRPRVAAGRLLHECRDADPRPGPARCGRGDAGAVDAVADPDDVPGPGAMHGGDRGVYHELLGRCGRRPAPGRAAPGVLLVGLGVPACHTRDGGAARARPALAAGAPRSGGPPLRPDQHCALVGRSPGDNLRPQADRPGRARLAARRVRARRAERRPSFRAAATGARGATGRPAPLPGAGLQRSAGRLLPGHLPRVRRILLRLPVLPGGAGPVTARGGVVGGALGLYLTPGETAGGGSLRGQPLRLLILGPLRRSRVNAHRAPPRPSNRTRPTRVLRTVSVAGVWASPAAGRPRRAERLVALATRSVA